jgi:glycosyltransferase involved in cell wall biosynthesis
MSAEQSLRKRIVIVGATYVPQFSGAGYVLTLLLKSRFALSYDVIHINSRFINSLEEIEKVSIKKFILFFKHLWSLTRTLMFQKPDYVILNPAFNRNAFIKDSLYHLCATLLKCKVIWWSHTCGLQRLYDSSNSLMRGYIVRITKSVHSVVTVGEQQHSDFHNFMPASKLHTIYHGIPAENFSCKYVGGKTGKLQVLYFSNLENAKGWRILLDAAKEICIKNNDIIFDFYGNPYNDTTLSDIQVAFQSTMFADRIRYHGPAYGEQKTKAFMNADIFCFPTYHPTETFGIVNIEAMNAGLSIITTLHSNIPEIVIDGKGGILIPKQDVDSLADAIMKLYKDESLRRRMGLYNQQRFNETFTLAMFEKRWIDFIQELEEQADLK